MESALNVEVLQWIQDTAVKAAGTDVASRVAVVSSVPDATKWLLIDRDGQHELLDKSQPPRNHVLLSVQEAAAYAEFVQTKKPGDNKGTPIIWISETGVIVTDDDERVLGDRASYVFRQTEEFKKVASLKTNTGMAQADILKLLRVDLAECFDVDDDRKSLIASLRKVTAQQVSAVGNGSGSYDATLVGQAGAAIDWPDDVMLAVKVFDDPSLTIKRLIRCAFDADAAKKVYTLTPIASHLTQAVIDTREHASEVIRQAVQKSEITVFLGSPS